MPRIVTRRPAEPQRRFKSAGARASLSVSCPQRRTSAQRGEGDDAPQHVRVPAAQAADRARGAGHDLRGQGRRAGGRRRRLSGHARAARRRARTPGASSRRPRTLLEALGWRPGPPGDDLELAGPAGLVREVLYGALLGRGRGGWRALPRVRGGPGRTRRRLRRARRATCRRRWAEVFAAFEVADAAVGSCAWAGPLTILRRSRPPFSALRQDRSAREPAAPSPRRRSPVSDRRRPPAAGHHWRRGRPPAPRRAPPPRAPAAGCPRRPQRPLEFQLAPHATGSSGRRLDRVDGGGQAPQRVRASARAASAAASPRTSARASTASPTSRRPPGAPCTAANTSGSHRRPCHPNRADRHHHRGGPMDSRRRRTHRRGPGAIDNQTWRPH